MKKEHRRDIVSPVGKSEEAKEGIVFSKVSKRYHGNDNPAVENVSLSVSGGDLVVILGTSGSGKTTLIKMVNRLIEPTEGNIFLKGSRIDTLQVNELRRRIGYVIQQIGLFPHRTVAQNVAVVPRLLGWNKERIEARSSELLEMLELPYDEFRYRYPSQLSGGQQQRVGIARALAADPDLLLMDEPFGSLDAITRKNLQQVMLSIQSRTKKTILFVTHDVEEALVLARRIIIMREGKVEQYDTPFAIINRPANEFVAELIGADDILRLLGLMSVRDLMEPIEKATSSVSALKVDDSLRHALGHMLRSGHDIMPVADLNGKLVGQLNLAMLRKHIADPEQT